MSKVKQNLSELTMIRRFKNHAMIHGWPSKSFKEKVLNYLSQTDISDDNKN